MVRKKNHDNLELPEIPFKTLDPSLNQHLLMLAERRDLKRLSAARNQELFIALRNELAKAGLDIKALGGVIRKVLHEGQETESSFQDKQPHSEAIEHSPGILSNNSKLRIHTPPYPWVLADIFDGKTQVDLQYDPTAFYSETKSGYLRYQVSSAHNTGSSMDIELGVGVWIPPDFPIFPFAPYGFAMVKANVDYRLRGNVYCTAADASILSGIGWFVFESDIEGKSVNMVVGNYGDLIDVHSNWGSANDLKYGTSTFSTSFTTRLGYQYQAFLVLTGSMFSAQGVEGSCFTSHADGSSFAAVKSIEVVCFP